MKNLIYLLLPAILLFACNPIEVPTETEITNAQPINLTDLEIPDDFNFETTGKVSFNISAIDNQGNTLRNVPVSLNIKRDNELIALSSGIIGNDGHFKTEIPLDKNIRQVILTTPYVGLAASHTVDINNSEISYVIGGDNSNGEVVNDIQNFIATNENYATSETAELRTVVPYTYIGSYNNQGVPSYLEPENDPITQDLLDVINASFPEGYPVPDNNPQYIADGVVSTIILNNSADVEVTFVHEGAGYRNALGYYTFPTNNPPATEEDITDLNIIFPNTSFAGSGGGLVSGNKVNLGNFPGGTTIAYFLVTNGWNSSQQIVETSSQIKYSDKHLNAYTTSENQAHVALLNDANRQIFLLGMEDITRPGGDKDFNDAVFYVTASPYSAVNTEGMASTVINGNDTDNDGVPDATDEYPYDPTAAFSTHSPGAGQYGTLAFEDLYPMRGDYDMNDVVVDYNVIYLKNAANQVSKMRFNLKLRAFGGGYRNGFAFEMPFPASDVSLVTGNSITENYLDMSSNGLESGQTNAVIVAFDNSYGLMTGNGSAYVNTEPGGGFTDEVEMTVEAVFSSPKNQSSCGVAPFNPFIMANGQRGYEVHLPDYTPTEKADLSLFGTGHDDSDVSTGKYYKTSNNLPWAIHLPSTFFYPIEKTPINQAYLKFSDWATSAGAQYTDWFEPLTGYRDSSKIY